MLKSAGYDVKETLLLADEQKLLEKELIRLSDQRQINLILRLAELDFPNVTGHRKQLSPSVTAWQTELLKPFVIIP